ncbi:MAG TPA: thioester reductase domain-containing protein [Acidobacteriota bacterium]
MSERSAPARPRFDTIVDYLGHWVREQPERRLFSFLDLEGCEKESFTYLEFDQRTRQVARQLATRVGLKRGDRALLVYPAGLDIIVAFFACARIGVIPVPVPPPAAMQSEGTLAKLAFIAADCEPAAALTSRTLLQACAALLREPRSASRRRQGPLELPPWVVTDAFEAENSGCADDPGPLLFLQYTSGSTGDPKGVMVSHRNVIHNAFSTLPQAPIAVSWLPQYHDMGLIGYYLFPAITGGTGYGFSALDFLKRPSLWLQTISRVRASHASAPNFGFEVCLDPERVPARELESVDLGSLRVLMNASEPVRCDIYARFLQRFGAYGLRPEAHVVAYGLAENTLAVSNHGRQVLTVNKKLLQQRTLRIENHRPKSSNQLPIVSCGQPLDGVGVRIVDPQSRAALGEDQVGEIWISGASACAGYWKRPELSRQVFGATLSDSDPDRSRYLRSGDLGFFHEGELFVCGRIKDLIIVRGLNYYPQDIESIAESASGKIRQGGVTAFQTESPDPSLVVLAEVRAPKDLPDPAEIARAIRAQYYVEPDTVALVRPRALLKTSSGKSARSLTRERWRAGRMEVLASYVRNRAAAAQPGNSSLRRRLNHLLEPYALDGTETMTFAELGIDSLTLVQLIEDIKTLLEERGAAELIPELDAKLLQRLTVADFFSLLDRLEAVPEPPVAEQRDFLRRAQQEHGAYEQERMRSDARLERWSELSIGARGGPATDVLLTGATGYLGPFLLASLLRRTPYRFQVLIRATDPSHGLDRIRAGLRRARVWTPELEQTLERRVQVRCGDLAAARLGLTAGEWESLALQVRAVVHGAALVNYVMGYDALRPHNVEGTRELLRFAFTGARKQFHFVSSTFIYGWTAKAVLLESDHNQAMENLDFGYAQSKWVAEQLVLAAERQGLEVRIYRPSLLSASTGGVGSGDDIAVRLLAFMINHGVAVRARNQISFLPVDIAADNIAAIVGQPRVAATALHVTADSYYNMTDVTRTISRDYGYRFGYYDIARFVDQMNRRCSRQDSLFPLLDFFNRSHPKIAAMQHKRYSNQAYRAARAQAGGVRGEPALAETVSYLIDFMRGAGIISKNARKLSPDPAAQRGARPPAARSISPTTTRITG